MNNDHPHRALPPDARLYASYVSSGQSPGVPTHGSTAFLDRLVTRHGPSDKSGLVVDIGCGSGALLAALARAGYTRTAGCDLSAEQVALAHQRGYAAVVQCDALTMLGRHEGNAEAVCMIDVLEHLELDEVLAVLDRAWKALRPGGRLIVHVPNAEGLFGMRVRYGDLTHKRAFTPTSLRQAFRVCGFDSISYHEDRPAVHGLKSAVRALLWQCTTLPARLTLLAETGSWGHVLSQNLLAVAHRPLAAEQRPARA
jgi:SAM-dependent methyltransferase